MRAQLETAGFTTPSDSLSGTHRHALSVTLLCAWLLMLITFSPAERDESVVLGAIDTVASIKIAVRGLVLTVLTIVVVRLWQHPRRSHVVRVLLPLGLFVAWAMLSTLWSPLKSVSLGQSGSLLVLLLMALSLGILCRESADMSTVLRLISLGLLFISTLLIVTHFAFPELGSISRDGSGVMHATNAGATASLGIIILLASSLLWEWTWAKALLVPGIPIYASVLLVSQNRCSLALTIVIAVGIVAMFGGRRRLSILMVTTAVAAAVYLALDPGLEAAEAGLQSAASYTARGQSTHQLTAISGREEMWTAVWKSYAESPWIGHGYFVSSRTGQLYVWFGETNWTAHNLMLQTLVSTGLVGAVLLVCGVLRPALLLLGRFARGVSARRTAILFAAMLAWYLGWGMLNSSLVGPLQPESVVFFAVLGIAVGRAISANDESSDLPTCETVHDSLPVYAGKMSGYSTIAERSSLITAKDMRR